MYNIIIAYNNYLCLIIIGTPRESFGRPIVRPIANLPQTRLDNIIISTISAAAGRMRRFYSLLFYIVTSIVLPTGECCYYYYIIITSFCDTSIYSSPQAARVFLRMHRRSSAHDTPHTIPYKVYNRHRVARKVVKNS